jgi:predicted lipoprotein
LVILLRRRIVKDWMSKALWLLCVSVLCVACSPESNTFESGEGDAGGAEDPVAAEARRRVLESVADRVVLPSLEAFVVSASQMRDAMAAWAASPTDDALRSSARRAFDEAMDDLQYLELMQFGPAGLMSDVVGGEGLRDEIYAWPLVNRCRVDQETMEPAHADAALLAAEQINVRGLGAVEYLMESTAEGNACAPNSALNQGPWLSETIEQRRARQVRYMATASTLIADLAVQLRDFWVPGAGDFRGALVDAGREGSPYPTVQEALNAVTDAMFYLEKETKDMKLAQPTGLRDCTAATCPEFLESAFALRSGRNVRVNLDAFVDLYHGGPDAAAGTGFDDLLDAVGQAELRADMDQRIAEAEQAVVRVESGMEQLLSEQPAVVVEVHDQMKLMLDLFKTQFVSVLDLDIPQRAEGDND